MRTGFTIAFAVAAALCGAGALPPATRRPARRIFNKCKTCHAITAADGTVIQKGGKVGPNLYGVVGRQAGTYPDFKYGPSMVAAGEKGLVWDEAKISAV